MNKFIIAYTFLFLIPFLSTAQNFQPIPKKEQQSYRFDFERNFFKTADELLKAEEEVKKMADSLNENLNSQNILDVSDWKDILGRYNRLEYQYRIIDLYYFLRFSLNASDYEPLEKSDLIRKEVLSVRNALRNRVQNLDSTQINNLTGSLPDSEYFFQKQRMARTSKKEKALEPFIYLKNNRFYDEALQKMTFEKLVIETDTIDVIEQQGFWENHPDEKIQDKAESLLIKGYGTQKEFLGYNYINFIKALDAFAKSEGYNGLIDKKMSEIYLSKQLVENFFKDITVHLNRPKNDSSKTQTDTLRFTIKEASGILEKAFSILGNDYTKEVEALLNPANGRVDIVGGANRLQLRGAASVYPIEPSIFYAMNYEGFLIDLTLLAHETGHAVQASLMQKNNVPMYYATGPGYFTESFGNFNELLVFKYLAESSKEENKKRFFKNQLNKRMNIVYGSSFEAILEYRLIEGILNGSINSPEDLDLETLKIGNEINKNRFSSRSYLRGLWMLLETNFRDPLHNVNDMIASMLAVRYYMAYESNPEEFIQKYLFLLRNGYVETPSKLLWNLGISIDDGTFTERVLNKLMEK